MSDRRAARALSAGPSAPWPRIGTAIADAGHESERLACRLEASAGWRLRIVKRRQHGSEIVGSNRIVKRGSGGLGRRRRPSEDHECRVRTSDVLIVIAASGRDDLPRIL